MTIYSHSRLSTFEQCPFKFKLRYIDKIKPEIEATIEAHLGTCVHETLEWLYGEVVNKRIPSVDSMISYYVSIWEKYYTSDIKIVKKCFNAKDYFNKGVGFLVDYYTKHQPFDDGTLELEKKIIIYLDDEGKYKMQGFIDRFTLNPHTNVYEIHDYKTANTLPSREKFEEDRQLALYSIGIKDLFGYDKDVHLIWHYLAHNTKIVSKRTNEQLQKLKEDIIELIKKIEATNEFPAKKSVLCDWCEFKGMCPYFGGRLNERQGKLEFDEDIKKENKLDIW